MIRQFVTIEDAIKVLNRAFEADPLAMDALRSAKVPCNDALANDPEIQVGICNRRKEAVQETNYYGVGFLGVVNGLFGIDDRTGYGAIAMSYDVDCPSGCEVDDGLRAGDKCPACGKGLVLGALLGFTKVDHEKLPDRTDK